MAPEEFESKLIEQLKGIGLYAVPYPQTPTKYYPEADPGEVLVRYEGRKPVERDTTGVYSEVLYYAEIVVASRQLRDENGAYDWLQQIYNHLEGYVIDDLVNPLQLEVESFMDEDDGLWYFGQKWSVKVELMQQNNDQNNVNLLGAD